MSKSLSFFVPRTRLELARRYPALAPQASVSTNFTTWAGFGIANINQFFQIRKKMFNLV